MELPAVAGHTLTARRGLSLLLVGGYSPENGFNQQLLEYQLATGTWVSGAQSGTPPTGEAAVGAVWTSRSFLSTPTFWSLPTMV